jgi:dTDP-glucose 4,6-dehydratase
MNLLVTGGAGFIGCHVLRHVVDRPEVARLVNFDCLTYAGHLENVADVADHPKYRFECADLRDKSAVARAVHGHAITHVLHVAAESHVDRSIAGPDAFIHTNIVGTFNLIEACREEWAGADGARRFVHVSTDEVYGSLGEQDAFTEGSPIAPNSPYSASKAAGELLARAYHRTYGFPVVVTNCSNNYGPFQFPEKLIPVAIQRLLERRPVPLYGDALHVRDWLHVRDHAEGLWLALTRGKPGETYNLGARNEWPNLRIVERLAALVDELATELGGGSQRLIEFVADRPGHDRRYALDPSKAERELGWRATRDFDAGLRETVQWYLANRDWTRAVSASSPPR